MRQFQLSSEVQRSVDKMRSHLNSLAVFHIQIVWKVSPNIRADFKLPQDSGLQDSSVCNFYSACSSVKMKLTTAVESILTSLIIPLLFTNTATFESSVLSYLFHGVTTTNPMIKKEKISNCWNFILCEKEDYYIWYTKGTSTLMAIISKIWVV